MIPLATALYLQGHVIFKMRDTGYHNRIQMIQIPAKAGIILIFGIIPKRLQVAFSNSLQ